ncbi:hypothetical protein KQ910_21950 [Reyranella sp. MMS21-HV4-11]|uniref:Peptidase S53 domain-containing protein n=1 Tax=Reyranella humidisoli TaxID=2849149 RepID=A0ABS6ITA2_9HYPH|nr:DUF4114 domain-containing protein [Reyranella sp. MMS21-HV4-11]MBU8876453.1 hypothetical protein [Reyranella sp. MMS21-HV4-11]
MTISYVAFENSSFLDFQGYRSDVVPLSGGTVVDDFKVNVALVFERNAPASQLEALLGQDWGTRQQEIAQMTSAGTLWSTYGANAEAYQKAVDFLKSPDVNIKIRDFETTSTQYISSVESRTLWVELDKSAFETLFDTKLLQGQTATGKATWYWDGQLSLPTELSGAQGVAGLWFDSYEFTTALPDKTGVTPAPLDQGSQSVGNASTLRPDDKALYPSDIAANYYNFPLTGDTSLSVQTGTIGLLESDLGIRVKDNDFASLLATYRQGASIDTPGDAVGVDPGGDADKTSGERSLDVGIATTINPQSKLVLYAGSGKKDDAKSEPFTTYQAAIWDTRHDPEVISSSERFATSQMTPDSPFAFAVNQLLIDAALAGITVFSSAGDGGSGYQTANGLTNVSGARASQYSVIVGGTSLSSMEIATTDATLSTIMAKALAGDLDTIWRLVTNGLNVLPANALDCDRLIETVWNTYSLDDNTFAEKGYFGNLAGNGGVDSTQAIPWYQTAFGLTPTTTDGQALTGRGVPDVSANAGGNLFYLVPKPDMKETHGDAGTSAATPLWASLAIQINAILLDQGMHLKLGYMTDLLYIAAAVAPGSFNDIRVGNNTSSFYLNGTYHSDGQDITPTGHGYEADQGYDLASGLGSPNGLLLARAISEITNAQVHFATTPDVIDANGLGGWTSGTTQTLLLQTTANADATVTVTTGSTAIDASSAAHATYAWTSQLAQQSLQTDFDGTLLALFDGRTQGTLTQASVANGDSVSVTFNGTTTVAAQASLSASFGFADFFSDASNSVRLAQAVAVAETAGGADDLNVVVRMRQVAGADLSLMLYKVDDYNGTINGVAPNQAGYAALASVNAYEVIGGGSSINGPGDGSAAQSQIIGVDAGDLIAMQLTNVTNGDVFWAFSQANEVVNGSHVAHLWNYGANTWGWEDLYGGGDRDFNDLIVQLDFTSAVGQGLLV